MEKEKRRKKKRKPATSTSSSSTEQVSPPPPSHPPHHIFGPSWSEMYIFRYTSSTRVTGTIIKTAHEVLYTSKLNRAENMHFPFLFLSGLAAVMFPISNHAFPGPSASELRKEILSGGYHVLLGQNFKSVKCLAVQF